MSLVADAFVLRFLDQLNLLLEERVVAIRRVGMNREIHKLKGRLEGIKFLLADAERRRVEEPRINFWVANLRDVMYDADDLIDFCDMEIHRDDQPSYSWLTGCCSPVMRSQQRHELVVRMRSINGRLEEILKEKALFNLQPRNHKAEKEEKKENKVGLRSSPILDSDVVGIEDDAHKLISRMSRYKPQEACLLFAIIGMGGIGKTTLAQRIYGDHRVRIRFESMIWVNVSQNFVEKDILKGIISYAGGNYYGAESRPQLEEILRDTIRHKRFFLVLDDVWAMDVWTDLLKNPLTSCEPGSLVLVTTRDARVAKQMGAVFLHPVAPLSYENSWCLLYKTISFTQSDGDGEGDMDDLKDIAKPILDKCRGVPLAIKFIGRILQTRDRSQRAWKTVADSLEHFMAWSENPFMRALYLSYEALPSSLKPCFLYCSLFPENRILERQDVVQLWIAEGFVESKPGLALEDVAEDYYAELASRSLLHPELEDLELGPRCRMHDLVRDLALNLTKDDSYVVEHGQSEHRPTRRPTRTLRRLSMGSRGFIESTHQFLTELKGLRALLIFENSKLKNSELKGYLQQLTLLRVLDLRGSEIETLPSSIGDLMHLRYLNLSRTKIHNLPESIKDLWNLQFLNLHACSNLRTLPNGIAQLHKLRSLDFVHTRVNQTPVGLGKLKHLSSLKGFLISNDGDVSTLGDLKTLAYLRDLYVGNLEKASSGQEAELELKEHLKFLELSCSSAREDASPDVVERVFADLRPPPCVQRITIRGFSGRKYPMWMDSPTSLRNLTYLSLEQCRFCDRLPSLGDLPQLKYLHLSSWKEIIHIDYQFFGERAFPKLERLIFQDMAKWEIWREGPYGAFPHLKTVRLDKCPSLMRLPECLIQAKELTELVIIGADRLREIGNSWTVTKLHVEDNPNLEGISDLPMLKKLKIIRCPALEYVDKVSSLKRLEMLDFALESLPVWFRPELTVSLETLEVTGNSSLVDQLKNGKERHKVAHIPHLYARHPQ